MSKHITYQLEVSAYSPDTIPMETLAAYLADLAKLLGEPAHVHFKSLKKGSTIMAFRVEDEATPKVNARLTQVTENAAAPEVMKAFRALDKRLADDNAVGTLVVWSAENERSEVLRFPGRDRPKPVDYGVVKERGHLDGVPMSVTGRDATKHITLLDGDQLHTNISTNRDVAIRLLDSGTVYRKVVRVHGVGRWERDEEEGWQLREFKAEDFEVLDDVPLRETVAQLRAIEGSGWREEADPLSVLADLRGDSDDVRH